MILIIGLSTDPIILYFYNSLKHTKLPFAFINQAEIGSNIYISHDYIYSKAEDWRIQHSDVQAVFNRLVASPNEYILEHARQLELLFYLLEYIYPNVLNRPMACASNFSKPTQLSMLKLQHISLPDSTVLSGTYIPKEPNMIYKSISSYRSIVKPLIRDKRVVREPVLFQKRCDGYNVRVHCLSDMVTATKITADNIDYRYSNYKLSFGYNLPDKIKQECLEIKQQLLLEFTGIDLIKNRNNWQILEANPAPGYAFFEADDENKNITNMLITFFKRIYNAP